MRSRGSNFSEQELDVLYVRAPAQVRNLFEVLGDGKGQGPKKVFF